MKLKHSWTHTKTGGQYIVHGSHWDAELQCPRVDYTSVETGHKYSRTWDNFKERFTDNEMSCES